MNEEEKAKEKIYKIVRKTLDSVHDGGNITDSEIEITIANATPIAEMLGKLGSKYYLAWKELRSDIMVLESFLDVRKRR